MELLAFLETNRKNVRGRPTIFRLLWRHLYEGLLISATIQLEILKPYQEQNGEVFLHPEQMYQVRNI